METAGSICHTSYEFMAVLLSEFADHTAGVKTSRSTLSAIQQFFLNHSSVFGWTERQNLLTGGLDKSRHARCELCGLEPQCSLLLSLHNTPPRFGVTLGYHQWPLIIKQANAIRQNLEATLYHLHPHHLKTFNRDWFMYL